MDADFIVRRLNMEHDFIVKTVKEICQWPVDDNVVFTYIGDSEIKKDDIYGGWSVTIEGKLENVRHRFDVDIATNDVVYPGDCDYTCRCLVTNELIHLKSYSIVSVLAEKMQTFLSKGVLNSRAKDFDDAMSSIGKLIERVFWNCVFLGTLPLQIDEMLKRVGSCIDFEELCQESL